MAECPGRSLDIQRLDGSVSNVAFRTCRPEDAPLFRDFWEQVACETTHTYQTPERPPDFSKVADQWAHNLADPFVLRLGAFEAPTSRLIGQITLYPVFGGHPWTRHLGTFGMMVRREYWGTGVARILLQAVEEHAREVGVKKMEANVRVENERGLSFYRRAGYEIEGTRRRAAWIDGRFQDEHSIAKDLDRE